MLTTSLPQKFLWTKMQAEAGQSLSAILHRKELERRANDGTFMWGVGNSLGTKVQYMRALLVKHAVFSPMMSKPQAIDAEAANILIWTKYIDEGGVIRSMPRSHIVTSRADTRKGKKKMHFAIVAKSKDDIRHPSQLQLNASSFKNIDSKAFTIGASQVTSVVERQTYRESTPKVYRVSFVADLVEPYFVRLAAPMVVSGTSYRQFQRNLDKVSEPSAYLAEAEELFVRSEDAYDEGCNEHPHLSKTAYGSLIDAL